MKYEILELLDFLAEQAPVSILVQWFEEWKVVEKMYFVDCMEEVVEAFLVKFLVVFGEFVEVN